MRTYVDLSSSRAKPLDGREEEFTTESAAIQNDDVGDTSRCAPNETEVNNVVGEDVINVGNPQRSNSKRGGDRKHNSDMDSSVAACEKQESGRRKRRKTKKHSHTQAKAEESALQNGIYGTTSTPDAFKDHTGQANSATDASANFPDSSTNATPGGTAGNNSPGLSTPRETKTLRLNPNGKLLSSPRRGTIDANDDNDDATNQKRKLCGGPKDASKTSPLSLVACISYGKDENSRQSIGGLIDQVLLGNRRNERPKQRTEKRSPPSGPPKATHPFFLSKPTQSKASCPEQPPSRSQVSEQKDDSREPPVTADSIVQQRPPPPSGTRDHSLRGSSNQGRATKPARSGETREPVWPPSGIVHIRGSLPPAAGYDVPASRFASYQGRKAKGFTSNVPQSESVLSMPHLLTANENRGVDVPGNLLHQPEQVTCRGSELRDTTVTKISNSHVQGGRVSEGPDDSGHKKLNRPHPALTSLIDSIPTAKSSFERGECGDTPWIQKYAPKTGEEVLQLGPEAVMLRSWLQNHEISAVNTGNTTADAKSTKRTKAESGVKRKRHKRPKDLDSFIVSSSDEEPQMDALDGSTGEDDELAGGVTIPNKRSVVRSLDLQGNSKHGANDRRAANTVLLSGPSGCGKTAAVYAVARELGFEIFEINPGSRRSARDVVERVGDMTQNHLVHLLNQIDHVSSADSADPAFESTAPSEGQNTMKSFFKKKPEPASSTQQKPHASAPDARDGNAEKQTRNQKQSLILLEEVDILFEQDKHFWNGVHALMSQSKRPIIMTCNEEHLLPTDDVSLHAIFRFRPPSRDIAVDYLLLMAANEGHVIDRQPISELYTALGFDLRATIMHLDFWCQMAVGSKKSGLDWLVNCPSRGASSPSSDLARAVSCRTYGHGMGWYNHDMAAGEYDSLEKGSRLMMDCHDQWNIGIADWNEAKKDQSYPDMFSRLDALMQEDEASTVKSALDCICPEEDRKGPNKVGIIFLSTNYCPC